MSDKETGGNAFPTGSWEYDGPGNVLPYQEPGMTLRDYFAAKAMQEIISGMLIPENNAIPEARVANLAYLMADAMLKERNK